MAQYIDKSAVVAEIERLHKEWRWYSSTEAKYRCEVYRELFEFLDTLETKDADLEGEIIRVSKNEYFDFTDWKSVARHFYELGLNAQKGG